MEKHAILLTYMDLEADQLSQFIPTAFLSKECHKSTADP
jgi:hypothetical protein